MPELTPHLGPQLTFKLPHGISQFQAWAREKLHLSNCRLTVISAALHTLYCLFSCKASRLEATHHQQTTMSCWPPAPAPIHESIPQTTLN